MGDDFHYLETCILNKPNPPVTSTSRVSNFRVRQRTSPEVDEEKTVWFCSFYQKNKCAHKGPHSLVFRGKMRLAQHICAACWSKDKKRLEHPECSSSCPYSGSV